MPSRSALVGTPIQTMNAVLGYTTSVSLTAAASGTAQNGYKMPTDVVIITAADGSNTAVTLPDPYLQNWNVGDWYEIVNDTAQACVVFPPTGGKINNGSANASGAVAANTTVIVTISAVASGASKFVMQKGA